MVIGNNLIEKYKDFRVLYIIPYIINLINFINL